MNWEDVASMKKLKHLNLVFSQSCYGASLHKDWFSVGAKEVIGFAETNQNFFWILEYLKQKSLNSKDAFLETNKNILVRSKEDTLFKRALQQMGLDIGKDPSILIPPQREK